MKAVGLLKNLPVEDPESLIDLELPVPAPGPRDLLVKVEAVSVNPVDVWLRGEGDQDGEPAKILGFDAAGTVVGTGGDTNLFSEGDEVFYAGSIDRPGTDSEYHLVDERIVGRKPSNLTNAEAAAVPLTAITAWEILFDRFRLTGDSEGSILILGAAGGVGSMAIQLAKELTSLTVIATASRPESKEWAKKLGADQIVDHSLDLPAQIREVAPGGVNYVLSPHSQGMAETFADLTAPFGHIAGIDGPDTFDVNPLKEKSIAWHWELMFTRSSFETPDMVEQHRLLNNVAGLIENGKVVTTLTETLTPINAATLREAHEKVESGRMVGKIVVSRE